MHSDTLLLNNADDNFHKFSIFLAFSFVLHIIFFTIYVFAPSILPDRKFQPSVINVDLVSFSAPPAAPKQSIPEPIQQTKAKKTIPIKKKVQKKTKIISTKKSVTINKKKKKSLKKKITRPSQTIDQAISQMKKKVEASQAQALSNRMSQLAREVKKQGKARKGAGGIGNSGTKGGQKSELINIYLTESRFKIEKNWRLPPQIKGDPSNLLVIMGIKIMPDGEIRESWFDRRSGNQYFDDSVKKAILKSNPLPPLPEGFDQPFLITGLRVTPSGVK